MNKYFRKINTFTDSPCIGVETTLVYMKGNTPLLTAVLARGRYRANQSINHQSCRNKQRLQLLAVLPSMKGGALCK